MAIMLGDKWADSAKGFWGLIGATIVAGIAWLAGSKVVIDWIMGRRNENR